MQLHWGRKGGKEEKGPSRGNFGRAPERRIQGKILGKDRVRGLKHPGGGALEDAAVLPNPFAESFWRGKSQLCCSAGHRGEARLEFHSSIIPVLGMGQATLDRSQG